MDERHIRAVLAVAECGSISSAASQLYMSVQGLKKVLDQLERDELGCELFIRTNKGVVLTQAGKSFCAEAPALLSHLRQFKENVVRSTNDELRISIWRGKEIPVLDEICRLYRKRFPDSAIIFKETHGIRFAQDICEGVADIGFYTKQFAQTDTSGLSYDTTGIRMSFLGLVSASHPLADQKALPPGELKNYPVGLATQQTSAAHWSLERELDIPMARIFPFDARYEIINFVEAGGICICDEYLAATFPQFDSHPLSWIEPIEILAGYRHPAPLSVLRFLECARETTAGDTSS